MAPRTILWRGHDGDAIYDAAEFRQFLWALTRGRQGVCKEDHLVVSATGPASMNLVVSAGAAVIAGVTTADQGSYFFYNDDDYTIGPVAPADGTNPRVDKVVAYVTDQEAGDLADNDDPFDILTGDPDPSPSAPATPDNAIALARISVPAGDTAINSGQITDARPFVNRALCVLLSSTSAQNIPNAASTAITGWTAVEDFQDMKDGNTIVIPAGLGGIYLVELAVRFAVETGSSSGVRYATVNVSGTPHRLAAAAPGMSVDEPIVGGGKLLRLVDGDTLTPLAFQNKGGDLHLAGGSGELHYFNAVRLGD